MLREAQVREYSRGYTAFASQDIRENGRPTEGMKKNIEEIHARQHRMKVSSELEANEPCICKG